MPKHERWCYAEYGFGLCECCAASYIEALDSIRGTHRPLEADDRLCAEGCNGSWPCSTRLEADEALGYPRPQRR